MINHANTKHKKCWCSYNTIKVNFKTRYIRNENNFTMTKGGNSSKRHNVFALVRPSNKRSKNWASLVAQRLRICLPMQGTRVWALVCEDPTCRGATRPVSHNYWACASGACALQQERPRQWEARALQWRVGPTRCN